MRDSERERERERGTMLGLVRLTSGQVLAVAEGIINVDISLARLSGTVSGEESQIGRAHV